MAERKMVIQAPASSSGQATGARRPQERQQSTPLTPAECKQLGGEVGAAAAGLCATGLYCIKPDNSGKIHSVCIDKLL